MLMFNIYWALKSEVINKFRVLHYFYHLNINLPMRPTLLLSPHFIDEGFEVYKNKIMWDGRSTTARNIYFTYGTLLDTQY